MPVPLAGHIAVRRRYILPFKVNLTIEPLLFLGPNVELASGGSGVESGGCHVTTVNGRMEDKT